MVSGTDDRRGDSWNGLRGSFVKAADATAGSGFGETQASKHRGLREVFSAREVKIGLGRAASDFPDKFSDWLNAVPCFEMVCCD